MHRLFADLKRAPIVRRRHVIYDPKTAAMCRHFCRRGACVVLRCVLTVSAAARTVTAAAAETAASSDEAYIVLAGDLNALAL